MTLNVLGHNYHPQSVMMARRGIQGQGRRLPPTPNKPSTLKLQQNINFPKLNPSPTRVSFHVLYYKMSFRIKASMSFIMKASIN